MIRCYGIITAGGFETPAEAIGSDDESSSAMPEEDTSFNLPPAEADENS